MEYMDDYYLPYSAKKDELSEFLDEWQEEICQKKTILRLNDDCFYKIVDFLSPTDLCSFRETCTRFRTIADYGFEKKHKVFPLTPENFGSKNKRLPLDDAKRLIRVFGGLITKITIDRTDLSGEPAILLLFLDRYCLQLRDLELSSLNPEIVSMCASETDRLFSNLHRLVIKRWVDDASIACCLERCVALKELVIIQTERMTGQFLAKYFESLESVTLEMCFICPLNIRAFFILNQHLKNLKYDFADCGSPYRPKNNELVAEVLRDIRLPVNLKRFEINFGLHDELGLMRTDGKNRILSYLAKRTSLQHLLLSSVDLNSNSVEILCRIKNLKTLKLTFMSWRRVLVIDRELHAGIVDAESVTPISSANILGVEQCKKLANELPDLTEIHIMAYPNITFDSIKEFIVNSKNLRKIFFHRYITSEQTLTSQMILHLIEVRRKEEFGKGTLEIFLRQEDIVDINAQFECNGGSKTFFEHQSIIKLLSTGEF